MSRSIIGAIATTVAAALLHQVAYAITLGFHDTSDPVKTSGWACAAGSSAPVRVHLYADIDGRLVHLDSQLADRRRDDLPFICDGAAHAFRFADYATTPDGVALYSRDTAVTMRVLAETPTGQQLLNGSPRTVSFAAVGLWDPGLVNGRWRTDLDNPREGTIDAPLLLGECAFATPLSDGYPAFSGGGGEGLSTECRYGSIVNPVSNAASFDGTWPRDSYWVVTANVEPAFANTPCANGPPGQSLPVQAPGTGSLFGVAALPDGQSWRPDRRKMHLVLNSWNAVECREHSYAIPYLSFGAQADRGNNGVITYLNKPGAKTALSFGLTLMDIAEKNAAFGTMPAGQSRYRQSHVLIEASWGGRKRWLFIEVLPDARRAANGGGIDAHVRFNWHMANSFIHPGADYVFKSAQLLSRQCAQEDVSVPVQQAGATYVDAATRTASRIPVTIEIQRTFDCLQRLGTWGADPMPSHPVPITGIHFGIEIDDRLYANGFTGATLPNALWIAIDGIEVR